MPRSGTTLVQSIIATSSAVFTLPETHLFAVAKGVFTETPSSIRMARTSLRLARRLASLGLNPLIWAKSGEHVIKTIDNKLQSRARAAGKEHYLEKTPAHLYFASSIKAANINAKIVFVVRSMPPNAISYSKAAAHWGKTKDERDLTSAISRWYSDTCLSILRSAEVGGHIVHYDKLLDSKLRQSEVAKLEAFLDLSLSFEPDSLQTAAAGIVQKHEHWKSNNLSGEIEATNIPASFLSDVMERSAILSEALEGLLVTPEPTATKFVKPD